MDLNGSQDVLDSSLRSCFPLPFLFLQAFPTCWPRRESLSQTAAHPRGLDGSQRELLARRPENKPHPGNGDASQRFSALDRRHRGLEMGLGFGPPASGTAVTSCARGW